MEKCNVFKHKTYDGVLKVAISKIDGTKFYDIENRGGFITSYIRNTLGIEVPTLYFRKKYKMEYGHEWWQQWFDIVDEDRPSTKKCPYCNWETYDINNKTGAMVIHINNIHNKGINDVINEFPEYRDYFSKAVKKEKREKDFKDEKNYVICPICGEKFYKLTKAHIETHGVTFKEFKENYPNIKTYSDAMIEQIVGVQYLANLKVSKKRFTSRYEKEICSLLKQYGIKFETNRQILIGRELDIYMPDKKIAIEFNGLIWHTEWWGKKDRHYHLEKTEKCNEKGVGLIHIFEDEYVEKKDIVESKIKHILNISDDTIQKIYARKTIITEINNNIAKEFLNKNHIQGYTPSTIYLGAYYNNEIIGVMTFKEDYKGSNRWELTRFATKLNTICSGLGGKLFKTFIREYSPLEVKSFADRRWTIDIYNNLYTKIGFTLEKILKPDYCYYNNKRGKYKRFHKFLFRKQILHKKYGFPLTMTETEMVKELGYDRIWNCGLVKYVWRHE